MPCCVSLLMLDPGPNEVVVLTDTPGTTHAGTSLRRISAGSLIERDVMFTKAGEVRDDGYR